MSQPQDSVPDEASFEGLVDLGSIPPAANEPPSGDVHAARTTVARVSESFLDELKRGRAEAAAFQNEAPTKPKGLVVLATSTMPPEPELPLGALEVTIDVPEPPRPLGAYAVRATPTPVAAPPPVAPPPLVRASRRETWLRRITSLDLRRAAAVLVAASLVAAVAVAALFFWAGHR